MMVRRKKDICCTSRVCCFFSLFVSRTLLFVWVSGFTCDCLSSLGWSVASTVLVLLRSVFEEWKHFSVWKPRGFFFMCLVMPLFLSRANKNNRSWKTAKISNKVFYDLSFSRKQIAIPVQVFLLIPLNHLHHKHWRRWCKLKRKQRFKSLSFQGKKKHFSSNTRLQRAFLGIGVSSNFACSCTRASLEKTELQLEMCVWPFAWLAE